MERRQQIIAEYWRRGRLQYKLWNQIQRKIEARFQDCLRRRTGILFINCTRGGGKTNWGVTKACEYLRNQGIKRPQVFLATAYAEDLRTIITPTFDQVMEDKPPAIRIEHIPSKKMYLDHQTGGMVHYRGLDLKRNSLRGNYADLVIIEECQNVRNLAYQWNYVVKQLFRHRPFPMAVFIGTPPESPDHDWVEIMDIAKDPKNDAYVEATIDEHDRMGPQEKAFMLKDLKPDAIQREYYCKVVIDKTRAIVPEWTDDLITEWPRDEFFPYYQHYTFMDLGVVDQTVGLIAWYDFRNATLVIEDEYMMQGPEMTTDLLAAQIRESETRNRGTTPTYLRISDNDNLLLLNDLAAKYALPFAQVRKTTLEAMVNEVRIWVRNGRIRIHPRCRLLIGCLRTGIWNEKREAFHRSDVYGHYDALAALIYGVRMLNTTVNPIPATHGMPLSNHYLTKSVLSSHSQDAKALKKAFRLNR